jgi:hypothetical protein
VQYSAKLSTSKNKKPPNYLNANNILYRPSNQYQLHMICANLAG